MKRSPYSARDGVFRNHRFNLLAGSIALLAAGVVWVSFDPRPADPPRPEVLRLTAAAGSPHRLLAGDPPVDGQVQFAVEERPEVVEALGPPVTPATLEGRQALELYLSLLERGYEKLLQIPAYSATFAKRERVHGELSDCQVMQMKLRHEPFSIYLKWLNGDLGREALYVAGQHEGKMLVRLGGWKGRLMPPLRLSPDGDLALEQSRYPITEVGILQLSKKLIADRRADLATGRPLRCRMIADQACDDRPCYYFDLEYDAQQVSEVYRRSVLYIDKEWLLPVQIKNYTWPQAGADLAQASLDEQTLIEHYIYSNVRLNASLADKDFDRANSEYSFLR